MIYVLTGPTCSGKTTIFKQLKILGYKTVVSYTTRPKRPNETEGKDYFFITEDEYRELDKKNKLIAKNSFLTVFRTVWYYGINSDTINPNEKLVVITEPKGYRDLIKEFGKEKVKGIYIKHNYNIRLGRGMSRGDEIEELVRRLIDDEIDFEDFDKEADYIVTSKQFSEVLNEVVSILGEA